MWRGGEESRYERHPRHDEYSRPGTAHHDQMIRELQYQRVGTAVGQFRQASRTSRIRSGSRARHRTRSGIGEGRAAGLAPPVCQIRSSLKDRGRVKRRGWSLVGGCLSRFPGSRWPCGRPGAGGRSSWRPAGRTTWTRPTGEGTGPRPDGYADYLGTASPWRWGRGRITAGRSQFRDVFAVRLRVLSPDHSDTAVAARWIDHLERREERCRSW
jgi:hypothetical protein